MAAALPTTSDLIGDLSAESADLEQLVSDLDDPRWRTTTPAVGWTIAHQIGHLAWTDRVATLAVTDPDAFAHVVDEAATAPLTFVDDAAEVEAAQPAAAILAAWRAGRVALADALHGAPAGLRVPWFGPSMSVSSMATARIMETWAHGQDVADALGVTRRPTARLRAVAHLGVRTRDFAYALHGKPCPTEPFRVALVGPDGDVWEWGPADAADAITGPALDFCLLVTQRRAPEDLDLRINGAHAREWSTLAQCFAGLPGAGRASSTGAGAS